MANGSKPVHPNRDLELKQSQRLVTIYCTKNNSPPGHWYLHNSNLLCEHVNSLANVSDSSKSRSNERY